MTKEQIVKSLKLSIKTARVFQKSGMAKPDTKIRVQGLIEGYQYAIELLKSK